jgi:hypothetical protein
VTAGAPLIVTAELPADLHAWATALRRTHFPPERNHLEAHVTLFHALPPSCEDEARELIAGLAADYAPVQARLEGAMSLGRGVALRISSPGMLDLRDRMAERFHGLLTPQDEHPPRLHVTVQNKVSPPEARALLQRLQHGIESRGFAFRGLGLHRYLGAAWELVRTFAFRGRLGA